MLSSDRGKTNPYNMTFSPSNVEQNSNNLLNYLNEKVKCLEKENTELKKEIGMSSQDRDKTDYFLRLRRELLEEIEKLKNENANQEIRSNAEIEKMQSEINGLNKKICNQNLFTPGKSNEEDFLQIEGTVSQNENFQNKILNNSLITSSKYFQNLIENEVVSNYSEDNFFLNPLSSGKNVLNHVLMSEKNNLQQQEENQKESSTFMIQPNALTNINPFVPIINDFEERVKQLESQLQQKEDEIVNLLTNSDKTRKENEKEIERLQHDGESWKQKYIQIMTTKKSLSEEFNELFEIKNSEFRDDKDRYVYELEKKIMFLEKMNEKYETDLEKSTKMNAESENAKQAELESLKTNLTTIVNHYEELYKNYEENIKILLKQMDSYKQLYMVRENEFLNITNYYTETIKDYSKPVADLNSSQFKSIEDSFFTQVKEVGDLRKNVDSLIKELANVKEEYANQKVDIRQKVSTSMRIYDENLKSIVGTHEKIQFKLERIIDFMNFFETKITFFNSLLEDNTKLKQSINELEINLKMMDSDKRDRENVKLREQLFKLQKDLEIKNNLIKEYEEVIPKYQESLHTTKGKNVRENVSEEVLLKMKNEIVLLNNLVTGVSKTKESIEKFYQVELKSSLDKINEKNEKIEELCTIIKRMENDAMGKKETLFNFWMLEFREFKEILFTATEIKYLIEHFKVEKEELTIHKDRVYSEELYLLRQEIKAKDDYFSELKINFEVEKNQLVDLIENYKCTIDSKVNILESLINQKTNEICVLKNDRQRLGEIENAKKNLTENEVKLWNDQKEHIRKILQEHSETKNQEISVMKYQTEILQNELEFSRKHNETNLSSIIISVENQMNLLKEREMFTVNQLVELEEKFKVYREDRERSNILLKEELQELKANNSLLSKIKS